MYRGDTKGTGWDFGVGYEPMRWVSLATVVTNVMQPVVRGEVQLATVVPSIALQPFGPLLTISSEGRFTKDSVVGYALDARVATGGRFAVALLARLDADPFIPPHRLGVRPFDRRSRASRVHGRHSPEHQSRGPSQPLRTDLPHRRALSAGAGPQPESAGEQTVNAAPDRPQPAR